MTPRISFSFIIRCSIPSISISLTCIDEKGVGRRSEDKSRLFYMFDWLQACRCADLNILCSVSRASQKDLNIIKANGAIYYLASQNAVILFTWIRQCRTFKKPFECLRILHTPWRQLAVLWFINMCWSQAALEFYYRCCISVPNNFPHAYRKV